MATVAKRAIHRHFTGLGREHFKNLRDHDGPVRAGGSFAGRENFFHRLCITPGIMLLVFILKAARIFAAVTRTALVRCWRGSVGHEGTRCAKKVNTARKFPLRRRRLRGFG